MPNWDEIQKEWETSEKTFKELAEKHGVKDSTIRSRKNREKWQRNATENNATQRATKTKSVATQKDVAKPESKRKEQKNRSGNPNPSHRFPNHNSIRTKHGLFSKFLHEEQVEIIKVMDGLDFADQIWLQIELKFSAIIRMQKIMWVEDEYDHLDKKSGHHSTESGGGVTYAVVYAHERYESYIKAQARAMAEYRNLVKQYIELTDEFDERRLKLEGMQANIAKSKAEVDKIKKENKEISPPTINIVDAWSDDDE